MSLDHDAAGAPVRSVAGTLVRAELSRLLARRFVQLMAVLLAAAFAVTVATTVAGSHEPTADEWERAEVLVVEERANRDEQLRTVCSGSQRPAEYCEQLRTQEPRIEDYLFGVFVFEREITPLLFFLIAFLALFAFLVAASFVGAELHSGGMTNLLLWRPQRLTVLGAKLGTLLAALLAVAVTATVVYIGAFWVVGTVSGLRGDVDGEFWADLVMLIVRGLAVVLGAGAVGFTLATLGRHTAAALGTVAAYGTVWEIGARIVMEVVEVGRPDVLVLSTYLAAWVDGHVTLVDRRACMPSYTSACDGTYTLTWAHGGLVLTALVAALVITAFTTFRRRDLT
ncbi:ABC transporter permease [Actinomycetes bacterium KLBMP 9797]